MEVFTLLQEYIPLYCAGANGIPPPPIWKAFQNWRYEEKKRGGKGGGKKEEKIDERDKYWNNKHPWESDLVEEMTGLVHPIWLILCVVPDQRGFSRTRVNSEISILQGWGAGAGRSRVFLAPWSRSRLKKNEEPEPLEKKSQEPEPVKISRLLSPAGR